MRASQSEDRRIGVLVMIDSLQRPGGGERLAMEGVRRLDPDRFRRTLCITRWSDAVASEEPAKGMLAELERSGVRLVKIRRSSRLDLRAWAPLWRELRRGDTEVVHGHLAGSNFWACIWGRLAGVPVVVAHEHMWSYSSGRLRPLIDREIIARLSSAFVAVSEQGRRSMIEREGIDASDLVLLRNGIEAPTRISSQEARRRLRLEKAEIVVGSVGHLRTEKAFEVLIRAIAEPGLRGRGVHAVVIGEGPQREMLERLAGELGIANRVHLVGARDDAAQLPAGFDVAACCSRFEGGPLSVMEYMAAGTPIVAADVGGLPELLEGGRAGVLVRVDSPPALAAGVAEVLDDPAAAARRAELAFELREREYDVGAWARRLEELYQRLLARSAVH